MRPPVVNRTYIDYIRKTVWDFFANKGFAAAQTAGMMGNLFQESSWNPLLRRAGSQFWGLFQINQNLARGLHSEFANAGLDMNRFGYEIPTYQTIGGRGNIPRNYLTIILRVQLEFAYRQQPTAREWNLPLRNATTAEEAAEIFLVHYLGAISGLNSQDEDDRLLYYRGINVGGVQRVFFQNASARRRFALEYYERFK